MKYLPLMCLVLLCLLFTNCDPDKPIKPAVDPATTLFTESINTLFETSNLAGMTVTVVKNGDIIVQQSFGKANVTNKTAYTNQTNQPIGSVSKTFVGLALMKAVEQGHFRLETPINDILPFSIINPNTPDKPILVRHLATHTGGLADSDETYDLQYYIKEDENVLLPASQVILAFGVEMGNGHALGDYLQAVYTPDGPIYDEDTFLEEGPGEVYEYTNIGTSLAAYLIEVKTGQSFADYVQEYIFTPLQMANTSYDRSELAQDKLATLYLSKEYEFPEYGHSSYPDGFVNTTNEDLTNYLLEMLKGANGTGTLLSVENYQTLFTRQSPAHLTAADGEVHTIFWDLTPDGRIEHNGSDPGVTTILSFDPMTNSGYLMMANTNAGGLGGPLEVDDFAAVRDFFEMAEYVQEFEQE